METRQQRRYLDRHGKPSNVCVVKGDDDFPFEAMFGERFRQTLLKNAAIADAEIFDAAQAHVDSLRAEAAGFKVLTSTTGPAPAPEPDYMRVEYPRTEGERTRIYIHERFRVI